MLGSVADTDDAVQETLIRACRTLAGYDPDRAPADDLAVPYCHRRVHRRASWRPQTGLSCTGPGLSRLLVLVSGSPGEDPGCGARRKVQWDARENCSRRDEKCSGQWSAQPGERAFTADDVAGEVVVVGEALRRRSGQRRC